MKTKFRKIFLIAAVVTLLSVIFCFNASAKDLDASGECGENVRWTYYGSTNKLVISGTGAMEDFNFFVFDEIVSASPFAETDIKTVVIEEGVTSIGQTAFLNCASLTSVSLPDSIEVIGDSAFRNCRKLSKINFPNGISTIKGAAFYNCDSLTKLSLPVNTTVIETEAFYDCDGIEFVNVPHGVTRIEKSTFAMCDNLKSVDLGNGVTSLGYGAFAWCTSLKNVDIRSNITEMDATVFSETPWLKNQPKGMVYVGKCAYIYNGEMPKNAKVTIKDGTSFIVPGAFYGQSNLKTLDIPASVTFIGYAAFSDCDGLKYVYYRGTKAQWKNVDVDSSDNSSLLNAKFYYGNTPVTEPSTTQPTTKPTEPTTQAPKPQEPTTQAPEKEETEVDTKVKGIKVKNVKSTEATVTWKKAKGIDSYEVYYFTGNGSVKIKKTKKNSITLKKLSSGSKYSVTVYGMKDGITMAGSDFKEFTTKVSAPALKSVKSVKVKQATVTWKQVKNASGYVVEYSTSKKFTKKTTKTVKIKKGKTVKATLKKLKSGKKYYVRIKAYKTVSKKAVYGSYSKIKTVKIK